MRWRFFSSHTALELQLMAEKGAWLIWWWPFGVYLEPLYKQIYETNTFRTLSTLSCKGFVRNCVTCAEFCHSFFSKCAGTGPKAGTALENTTHFVWSSRGDVARLYWIRCLGDGCSIARVLFYKNHSLIKLNMSSIILYTVSLKDRKKCETIWMKLAIKWLLHKKMIFNSCSFVFFIPYPLWQLFPAMGSCGVEDW